MKMVKVFLAMLFILYSCHTFEFVDSLRRLECESRNPMHFVPTGKDAPEVVNVIIEISGGTNTKYEIDEETGMLKLDRVFYSAVFYPQNYGFIPRTMGGDDDPVDILVISSVKIQPNSLVQAKVLGYVETIDSGNVDDKVIAVAKNDMTVNYMNNIDDVPQHIKNQIAQFYREYKKLEGREVLVGNFYDKYGAHAVIEEGIEEYRRRFPQLKTQ